MRKINIDTLGKMSDNEVDFLLKKIKLEIQNINEDRKKRRSRYDQERLNEVQEEYCYVKRECDSRYMRRDAHRQYIESNPKKYEELFLN